MPTAPMKIPPYPLSGWIGSEGHFESEGLQFAHERLGHGLLGAFVQEIGAQFAVTLASRHHGVGRHQDAVAYRNACSSLAATTKDVVILAMEVTFLDFAGCPSRFHQGRTKP